MVLTCHYGNFFTNPKGMTAFLWTGVILFFVISGYVFGNLIFQRTEKLSRFFIKRVFRIYPLYFVSLICYFFLTPENASKGLYFLKHLFFLNTTASIEEAYFFNPAYWSLPVEVEFYLVVPLLILLRKKLGARIIYALFAVSLLLKFFLAFHSGDEPNINVYNILGAHILGMFPEFGVGILLYGLTDGAKKSFKYDAHIFLTSGIGILAGCACLFMERQAVGSYPHIIIKAYFTTFCALGFALMLLAAIKYFRNFKAMDKPFLQLGALSYGTYLFHNAVPHIFDRYHIPTSGFRGYMAAAACTTLIAVIACRTVEMPLRDYGRRLVRGPRV